MTNPFRTQRERAAYEAGRSFERAQAQKEHEPMSRARLDKMSPAEMQERWDTEIAPWLEAGQPEPEGDDDE